MWRILDERTTEIMGLVTLEALCRLQTCTDNDVSLLTSKIMNMMQEHLIHSGIAHASNEALAQSNHGSIGVQVDAPATMNVVFRAIRFGAHLAINYPILLLRELVSAGT